MAPDQRFALWTQELNQNAEPPEKKKVPRKCCKKKAGAQTCSCAQLHLAPDAFRRSSPVQSAVCAFCGQRKAADILLTSPDRNAQGDSQVGQR